MEKVSVIIPTHFRSDRLKNALASVMRQTWKKIEIIVVSDGFDEETDTYMKLIRLEDERIKYITYKNSQGANHARNIGIENASGEFVAFLDDDDVWHKDKIARQITIMNKDEKIGIVNCGVRSIFVESDTYYDSSLVCEGDISKNILYGNCIGSTSAVMVRKIALNQCGGFDEDLPAMQDFDLWIRICQKFQVDTVREIQLYYYNYNASGAQTQISRSLAKYLDAIKIINRKYAKLYEYLSKKEKDEINASHNLILAEQAIKTHNNNLARKYALASLKKKKTIKALCFMLCPQMPYGLLIKLRGARKCKGKIKCVNT